LVSFLIDVCLSGSIGLLSSVWYHYIVQLSIRVLFLSLVWNLNGFSVGNSHGNSVGLSNSVRVCFNMVVVIIGRVTGDSINACDTSMRVFKGRVRAITRSSNVSEIDIVVVMIG